MKVLMLTVSAGEGHNAMSRALDLCLNKKCETRIFDIFNNKAKFQKKAVNDGYFWICKVNLKLANGFYEKLKKRNPEKREHTFMQTMIKPAMKNVEAEIESFQPDVIFCAHTYAGSIMSDLRKKKGIDIPVVSIVSDYDLSPYIECSIYIDYIISPSDYFDDQLLAKGFKLEQIRHLGIPVQTKFSETIDKLEARNALGLKRDMFTIMIMNGGVGFGDNLSLIKNIMKSKHKDKFQIVLVNGRNEKMKASVDEYIQEEGIANILNIGFAKNVDVIMSASDILIGKIGGVAIAEAFNKKLPILAAKRQPWQEYDNMIFLRERGACDYIEDSEKVYEKIDEFIENPEKREAMIESMARIAKPNASRDIAALLLELGSKSAAQKSDGEQANEI